MTWNTFHLHLALVCFVLSSCISYFFLKKDQMLWEVVLLFGTFFSINTYSKLLCVYCRAYTYVFEKNILGKREREPKTAKFIWIFFVFTNFRCFCLGSYLMDGVNLEAAVMVKSFCNKSGAFAMTFINNESK